MFSSIVKKIIGSKNERELKKLWPIVAQINAMESLIASLTDDQLRGNSRHRVDECIKGGALKDGIG